MLADVEHLRVGGEVEHAEEAFVMTRDRLVEPARVLVPVRPLVAVPGGGLLSVRGGHVNVPQGLSVHVYTP